jgi:ATP phosphoribosyltransferase regulatory subunit
LAGAGTGAKRWRHFRTDGVTPNDSTDDKPHPALLPAGLRDLLPPEAETEAAAVEALMAACFAHGYQRVKPPLLEFEDTLFAGAGAAMVDQTFRLLDPDTRRMMGVRADMTPQVARIATTRLAGGARPLRLSYAGQCLRQGADAREPERQIAQAGIELIGADSPEADAEAVAVAAEALASLGVTRTSFDLTHPPLIPSFLEESGIASTALSHALDRKDAAEVAKRAGKLAGTLTELLLAAGPARRALAALAAAPLTPRAREHADRLAATVATIQARAPGLVLTVDPVEFRGLRYHTGVCVTIYAAGRVEELGRGGRYLCGEAEPATGITLYPDAVLRAAPSRPARPRLYVPAGMDGSAARAAGFATVAGLAVVSDTEGEARRLGCGYVLGADGKPVLLEKRHG